jgi:hypothetical protein
MNCKLAGYSSCRWATEDITGGAAMCTKMCAAIDDPAWCEGVHCVWNPTTGKCRKKCAEFQMEGPCVSTGCLWVGPPEGYQVSQCIPPGTQLVPEGTGCLVNKTNSSCTMKINATHFFAEQQTFKYPTSANSTNLRQSVKKH